MIPLSDSLKSELTCTQTRESIPDIKDFMDLTEIHGFTMKSARILLKSTDLQGFHRHIPECSE